MRAPYVVMTISALLIIGGMLGGVLVDPALFWFCLVPLALLCM